MNDNSVQTDRRLTLMMLIGYTGLFAVAALSAVFAYLLITKIELSTRPTCSTDQLIISEWSECAEGFQTRVITPRTTCEMPKDLEIKRECVSEKKRVYLFKKGVKEYTTQIDTSDSVNPYHPNYNNIRLVTRSGAVKEATLFITAITTVYDGSIYQIPEFYYAMLGINESPRIVGATRLSPTKVDTGSPGIFQGTETPKTLEFNLNSLIQAHNGSEGPGSTTTDYVALINQNKGPIDMTLFIADGRSMVDPDLLKRIYGTITDAYIEYSCESPGACDIERVPLLQIP